MKTIVSLALVGIMALTQTACGSVTIGIAVAGIGIGGAALESYCAAGGSGCSPAVTAFAALVVSQATADAAVLESGASTVTEIQSVIANLRSALAEGQTIPGLSGTQQAEVNAIVTAVNETLTLAIALTPAGTSGGAVSANSAAVVHIVLTSADKSKLAEMHSKIAAVRAKVIN